MTAIAEPRRPAVTRAWPLAAAALLGVLIGCATTGRGQPRMRAALDALRVADSELHAADPNKGGHRERAIELVERAIEQVQLGMEYAAR